MSSIITKVPRIDASQVISGTLADARIPNLNASKITAGTFANARISEASVDQHAVSVFSAMGIAPLIGTISNNGTANVDVAFLSEIALDSHAFIMFSGRNSTSSQVGVQLNLTTSGLITSATYQRSGLAVSRFSATPTQTLFAEQNATQAFITGITPTAGNRIGVELTIPNGRAVSAGFEPQCLYRTAYEDSNVDHCFVAGAFGCAGAGEGISGFRLKSASGTFTIDAIHGFKMRDAA